MKQLLQKLITCACVAFLLFIGCGITVSAANLSDLFDAAYYAKKYPDVTALYGNDPNMLYSHYANNGIHEGRIASPLFNVVEYRRHNPDLEGIYGDNWAAYVNRQRKAYRWRSGK